MNTKIKLPAFVIALFVTLFLTACGNKVDSALDKVENILSKYEDKTKNKTMTKEDMKDMERQIGENTSAIISTPQSEWTSAQKDRFKKISERGSQIVRDNFNLMMP
jgi:arsenate reductase-like glutaredoxin family protein